MSDHEKLNGFSAPEDDGIRPMKGLPEDDPEYVRDLLSRLKEEMEVIHKGESAAEKRGVSEQEYIVAVQPEMPAEDTSTPAPRTEPQAPAPAASVKPPVTPPSAPTVPSASRAKRLMDASYDPSASSWEELTMDAMIDDLIAEKKADRKSVV